MANSDTQTALAFHDATKLNYINLLTKPALYKSYPGVNQILLPEAEPPGASALDAILGPAASTAISLDLTGSAYYRIYLGNQRNFQNVIVGQTLFRGTVRPDKRIDLRNREYS